VCLGGRNRGGRGNRKGCYRTKSPCKGSTKIRSLGNKSLKKEERRRSRKGNWEHLKGGESFGENVIESRTPADGGDLKAKIWGGGKMGGSGRKRSEPL